jgi:hypothetical protein
LLNVLLQLANKLGLHAKKNKKNYHAQSFRLDCEDMSGLSIVEAATKQRSKDRD